MFYFHKVEYVQYLGEVDVLHTWVQKIIPLYNSTKIIKIDPDFPKLWSQMYCHLFYGSQCSTKQCVISFLKHGTSRTCTPLLLFS